jgi:hypothetical protein
MSQMGIAHVDEMNLASPRHQHDLDAAVFGHGPKLIDGINIRFAMRLGPNLFGARPGVCAALGRAENDWVAGMEFS